MSVFSFSPYFHPLILISINDFCLWQLFLRYLPDGYFSNSIITSFIGWDSTVWKNFPCSYLLNFEFYIMEFSWIHWAKVFSFHLFLCSDCLWVSQQEPWCSQTGPCIFLTRLRDRLSTSYFLAQDIPSSFCTFSVPVLKLAICPMSPCTFQWRTVFQKQDLVGPGF